MTKYAVNWDNGASASGTFPQRFDTELEASQFAEQWAAERNLEDLGLTDTEVHALGGEECYSAEVIEIDEPDTENGTWDEIGELRQAALDHKGRP